MSSKREGRLLLLVMPPISLHKEAINVYQLHMISRTLFTPFCSLEERGLLNKPDILMADILFQRQGTFI
jgi:hypothetical protein